MEQMISYDCLTDADYITKIGILLRTTRFCLQMILKEGSQSKILNNKVKRLYKDFQNIAYEYEKMIYSRPHGINVAESIMINQLFHSQHSDDEFDAYLQSCLVDTFHHFMTEGFYDNDDENSVDLLSEASKEEQLQKAKAQEYMSDIRALLVKPPKDCSKCFLYSNRQRNNVTRSDRDCFVRQLLCSKDENLYGVPLCDLSLCERIRFYKELRGLTTKEIATKVGVSRSAVNHWELGKRNPKLKEFMALCNVFQISFDELYYGKKEEKEMKA